MKKESARTKVSLGNVDGSLRTSIPSKFAKELDIKVGDELEWAVVVESQRKILKVRRVRLVESDQ